MARIPAIRKQPAWKFWEFAVYCALAAMGFGVVAVFAGWWFSIEHIPRNWSGPLHAVDILLFALLSYVVWYQIAMEILTWSAAFFMRHPVHMEPEHGLSVALVTAFVPGKEPYEILERALVAMKAVEYPHDTWVLDEGNDRVVRNLCRRYGAYHFSREGWAKYNTEAGHFKAKTKAGNFNAWFDKYGYAYEIVAQHDVDFVPRRDFLMKTLGYFRDPTVAFVGTPQIYGNVSDSWIARGAAEQAYGFYGPLQKGFFGLDMQLFIGANHVMRTRAHDDIGGYSGHIVEDHLTGMRLYANRWKSVYVPEALLVGEGPATWDAYFSQQMRWAYGLIDILFRHSPKIVGSMRLSHAFNYLLLQQYYFYGFAQAAGLVLITLFFAFGVQSATMDANVMLFLYPLVLLLQLSIFFWLQRAYIDPAKESGLHLSGKLLNVAAWPIYLLAFASALAGKKLNYQVTPKGASQAHGAPHLSTFFLHFAVGTLGAMAIALSFITGNQAPQLMFWAAITTALMYAFVLAAAWQRLRDAAARSASAIARIALIRGAPALIGTMLALGLAAWSSTVFVLSFSEEEKTQIAGVYRTIVLEGTLGVQALGEPVAAALFGRGW